MIVCDLDDGLARLENRSDDVEANRCEFRRPPSDSFDAAEYDFDQGVDVRIGEPDPRP